jgi:hypothetical protein
MKGHVPVHFLLHQFWLYTNRTSLLIQTNQSGVKKHPFLVADKCYVFRNHYCDKQDIIIAAHFYLISWNNKTTYNHAMCF